MVRRSCVLLGALLLWVQCGASTSHWRDEVVNSKHGYVVSSGLWVPAMHQRINYTLYLPNLSGVRRVPLVVFLHDIWSTSKDDADLNDLADEYAGKDRGKRAFALLKPEGNWMLQEAEELSEPWQTPDFPLFWASSEKLGDSRKAVMQLVGAVAKNYNVRGSFAIVGHGVGGWGARAIADANRGVFSAVGSLSGVTTAECLSGMLIKADKLRQFYTTRLGLGADQVNKAHIVMSKPESPILLAAMDLSMPENIQWWSKQDPNETLRGVHWGYRLNARRPDLLYIQVGRYDEFGLYSHNVALHAKLVKAKVEHTFVVSVDGEGCTVCVISPENPERCAECEELKACGTHRGDGPVEREASLMDATGRPVWHGSLRTAFGGFVHRAMDMMYGNRT